MIEAVLITYLNDFSTARVTLRSLKLYFPEIKKTHVLVDKKDISHWVTPNEVEINLLAKEDIWPKDLPYPNNGYHAQKLLKLLSYRFIESEFIWIIDSDMLLIQPLTHEKLGLLKHPYWFYSDWNQGNLSWKKEAEQFLGFTIPYSFMEDPLYILKKSILMDFFNRYSAEDFLKYPNISEFEAYGAFAYHAHRDEYAFISTTESHFAKCIHQVPPTYLVLDEAIGWKDYRDSALIAVWSNWSRALDKMIECYHDSQHFYFQEIRDHVTAIYTDYLLPDGKLYPRCIDGIYADHWVKPDVTIFPPPGTDTLKLTFNTHKRAKPICKIMLNAQCVETIALKPGEQAIKIILNTDSKDNTLKLHFEGKRAWHFRDKRILLTRLGVFYT
ncbi:MAG: hypothetical protein A3E84_02170 [Gammaproteobacteria bacterium RIFCSPHIGHO2_12_FULL_42_13]|nr:MAG: hypothetical protein A3E84_02170 [Gammaproteobacteria bacterium RIFCSPHIGHO2_12_FULL_42_13]